MSITVEDLAEILKVRLGQRLKMCFLAGAGCSRNLPCTPQVILTVLTHLIGPQASSKLTESHIRFEFFMQLLRDYCDPGLSFLLDLYYVQNDSSAPRAFTIYHQLFAGLIARGADVSIFTTNFDNLIEQAGEKLWDLPIPTIFQNKEFARSFGFRNSSDIFKK